MDRQPTSIFQNHDAWIVDYGWGEAYRLLSNGTVLKQQPAMYGEIKASESMAAEVRRLVQEHTKA